MNEKKNQNYNYDFADRLHQALDHKGYDRFKRTRLIANKLNLTTSPVSKWLNGHTIPLPSRLEQLCYAFEINSAFLITGTGPIDMIEDELSINAELLEECVYEVYNHLEGSPKEKIAQVIAELYTVSATENSLDKTALKRLIKLVK